MGCRASTPIARRSLHPKTTPAPHSQQASPLQTSNSGKKRIHRVQPVSSSGGVVLSAVAASLSSVRPTGIGATVAHGRNTSRARFSVDENVRRGSSPTSRFATEARRCSSLVGILDLRSSRRRPGLGTAPAKRRTPKTSVESRRAKGASRRLPGRKVVFDGRRRLRCRISRSSRLNRDTWGLSCALASWRTLDEPDVQECRSRTCCPPVWSGRRRGVSAVCVSLGSQTQLKGFRLLSKRSRRVCTCANVRVRCACSYGEYLFAICRPNLGSALFLRSTLSPSGERGVYNFFCFFFSFQTSLGLAFCPRYLLTFHMVGVI